MRSAATQKLCRSWRRALPCCRPCGASPGLTVLRALPSKMWKSITASLSTYNPSLHTFRQVDCTASYSCVRVSQCCWNVQDVSEELAGFALYPSGRFPAACATMPQHFPPLSGTSSHPCAVQDIISPHVLSKSSSHPMCYPRHRLTPCAVQVIISPQVLSKTPSCLIRHVCKQASS